MPVVQTTAYSILEDVITRARALINDLEVGAGDVLTDSAAFTLPLANIGYERGLHELIQVGVEVMVADVWLLAVPAITGVIDSEARVRIADDGTHILYPDGSGSASALPRLPDDLAVPLKLWERQTNTQNFPVPMLQPPGGVTVMTQQNFLIDWMWLDEALQFRGALQVQDVKLRYQKRLQPFVSVNDIVPFRWAGNVFARAIAMEFLRGRNAEHFKIMEDGFREEIEMVKNIWVRRRQRKTHRRRPYSGNRGRRHPNI